MDAEAQKQSDHRDLLELLGWRNLTADNRYGIMPGDVGPTRSTTPSLDSLDSIHVIEEGIKLKSALLWRLYRVTLSRLYDNDLDVLHATAIERVKCLKTVLLLKPYYGN